MQRRTLALVAGGTFVLLLGGLASAAVFLHGSRADRARAIDADHRAAVAAFHAQRWDRPVLRGAPLDGNAAEAQAAAVAALGALPSAALDKLTSANLAAGQRPGREILALAKANEAKLGELRRATQGGWAWTHIPFEQGASAPIPSFVPARRARKLLLALALASEPAECAPIAADTIRLAQDGAVGIGLIGPMIAAADIEIAAPVLVRCAARAGGEARAEAARELGVLSANPTPVGSAFEAEQVMMGSTIRPLAVDVPLLPTNSEQLDRWLNGGKALRAWEVMLADLPRYRRLDAKRYPEGFGWVESTAAAHAASPNPILAMTAPAVEKYLYRDAAANARLRGSAAIVEALRSEAPNTDAAPILARAELADPFSGAPLRWKLEDGRLSVWSVGPDKKDDGGGGDDVIVTTPKPEG